MGRLNMKRISAALVAVLAIALSLAAQAPASGSAVVKSIGFVKSDAGLEISVLVNGVFVHETYVLSSPDRLVIDVSPAERIEALPTYDVNAFGVTAVRTGQFKPKVSRVILDFSGPVPEYDVQKTDNGLIVKIAAPPPPAEKPAAPSAPVEPVQEEKPVGEAKPAPKVEIAAPAAKTAAPQAKIKEPAGGPVFYNTTVGLMGGSYKNDSERFGEVYGSGTSIQFGLNLSRTLLYVKGFHLDVSGEARLVSKSGKATLSGDEAKIRIYPLTVAALLMFDTKYIIPFAGYGRDWFNYKETSALADTSGSASGDHFQGGLFIIIPGLENLRLKLYYKHTRVTATENEIEVKLGGPEFGFGVSYGFNFLNGAALVIR
ncbi:MAG: hypothetical protein A2W03_07985 [Candidatus Aminicenantes bacterium RBG_16_63_16]|nr:MAG: hypothetical protein A2W03_07985 [Candidatus Aminicenantes bacterium RBG_16_63_16]